MPKTYEVPTFLGEPSIPVELVSQLESYIVEGSSVTLRCRTDRHEPAMYDFYGTRVEAVWDEPTPGVTVFIRLDFLTDEIVRIRYARETESSDWKAESWQTPMVVGQFEGQPALRVGEDENAVTLETAAIRVQIVREPWQINIFDQGGRLIWSTRAVDIAPLRRPEDQWNPPQQRWIFYHRFAYPFGTAQEGDRQHAFLSFDLHYDEHIYGFGESYGRLDKRETEQRLWIQEAFSNASPASYKRAPFFMSTRGYGLYVNTSNAVNAHVGDREHTALSLIVDDMQRLDLYFIYGPTLKDILPRYTAITGAPAVPPKWSFGLWMARISYNRQAQVEAVANQLREHGIPCDVIHIDTDWYERDWECDLQFGESKFPDPAGMTARLGEQGFRVCLWQWPNMVITSTMFGEGRADGYLAKRKSGKPYLFSGFDQDAGFIDYSNPEAVAWVQEKFRALFELGVAAIKVDFGEGAAPDAVYHNGQSEAMHSLYPLLYNRAIFEATQEYWGKGIVWARAAWAGSQRYPIHWSGDGIARYEDLACVLRAALSFGLSGFPFYSHDIGGFTGLPSPDLYVRWAQFGLFSSHARCHGVPPREPWAYGEEAERIFRRYDELRYQLMPYIFSEAVNCGETSLPMLRALVLDYQDDPTTYTIDDEYLFGSSLLVAPILDETNRRRVYLPHGDWMDYWTKEKQTGGRWIEVQAPLETMPLYIKAGAILPFAPLMQHVDERPYDPLTLEIYLPGAQGEYLIHDEDRSDIEVRYAREGSTMTVTVAGAPGAVILVFYGVEVTNAQIEGEIVALETGEYGETRLNLKGDGTATLNMGAMQ